MTDVEAGALEVMLTEHLSRDERLAMAADMIIELTPPELDRFADALDHLAAVVDDARIEHSATKHALGRGKRRPTKGDDLA